MPPTDALLRRASAFEAAAATTGASLHTALDAVAAGSATAFELSAATPQLQQQFVTLSAAKQMEVLARLAIGPTTASSIILTGVALDNTHAPALADIVRRPGLTKAVFERNNLSEVGLLLIAEALLATEGASTLTELSVANQRTPVSTAAMSRLLDAMEATPTLLKLGLGQLRDDGARKRHQQLTMANTEAKRRRRQQQQQQSQRSSGGDGDGDSGDGGEGGGGGGARGAPPLSRAGTLGERSSPCGGGGLSRAPSRNLSGALLQRVASIEGVVSSAIEDKVTSIDLSWMDLT
jgi:uncharacterized membrane protein YgcG